MQGVDVQPHTHLRKGQVHPICLVCGDPARTETFASQCDEAKEIAYNREYRTFNCVHKGTPMTVTSHGVGAPGAIICFEELHELGAKVIIRFGTCGSLQPDTIKIGTMVNITSSIREEKSSSQLIGESFPAVSDWRISLMLQQTASEQLCPTAYVDGMALSSDLFYRSPAIPSSLELYHKISVPCIDMESSSLYVWAKLRGVRAACVSVVDGTPLRWDKGDYNPTGEKVTSAKIDMIRVVRDVAIKLHKEMTCGC